ncbi:MAG: methenyltetrahydromethanopterin cyclohydrolase [Planctomycetia bacterium]|nr:methenyltetrahydromethanopterin cyclohydrolase [Planctomycetia bacterium]
MGRIKNAAWVISVKLNERALEVCRQFHAHGDALRVQLSKLSCGTQIIDCGVEAVGGLEAGRLLAECCLAGLGSVAFVPGRADVWPGPAVQVRTDQPIAACMASQYAGWEVKGDGFFAMGSGPMRAAANREKIFEAIGYSERPSVGVGVLESGKLPSAAVAMQLAEACGVAARDMLLLVAPTASHAGNVQIVARSIETTLHKLFELGFDLERVESGWGVAPLPPVAKNDLAGIGRTNDAILYGAEVVLWVRGDDESLKSIGPQVPSSSSRDYGEPFAAIFARYENDFYKIDKHLFSPAVVRLVNLDTGNSFCFGRVAPEVLKRSFGEAE